MTGNRDSDPFRFHLCAPAGQWINDPNALYFADGRYRLAVQHAASPQPDAVGWGAASSADLLHWQWDGALIPADARGQAWSGSRCDGAWWFTRQDAAAGLQTQHCRRGDAESQPVGPRGRNCRDPFVWRADDGLHMLVARPCDWHDWAATPPSQLEHWHQRPGGDWQPAGHIGPWSPPGVLWEVPVLITLAGRQILILSQVDRRGGGSDCRVVWWAGRGVFTPDPGQPADGWPLDLGPDCYAAIVSSGDGWPLAAPHLVAWASNWATARAMPWPGASHGGPITLPRALEWRDGRLHQRPLAAAAPLAAWHGTMPAAGHLRIRRGDAQLDLVINADGSATTRRAGTASHTALLAWQRDFAAGTVNPGVDRRISLFADGPMLELFIDPCGLTLTAALPGTGPLEVACA